MKWLPEPSEPSCEAPRSQALGLTTPGESKGRQPPDSMNSRSPAAPAKLRTISRGAAGEDALELLLVQPVIAARRQPGGDALQDGVADALSATAANSPAGMELASRRTPQLMS